MEFEEVPVRLSFTGGSDEFRDASFFELPRYSIRAKITVPGSVPVVRS